MSHLIEAKNVKKSFHSPKKVEILKGVSLSLAPGETLAICGKSGTGKSTLLHLLGGLETPSDGEILHLGQMYKYTAPLLQKVLGFVFQSFHLLEDYTAIENIIMPMKIARKRGQKPKTWYNRAHQLLCEVGLEERKDTLSRHLSGGEKQRIAIARALANEPKVILADEPTGNLDEENSKLVADLLFSLVNKSNTALLLVTHDEELASRCNRRMDLHGGTLHTVS